MRGHDEEEEEILSKPLTPESQKILLESRSRSRELPPMTPERPKRRVKNIEIAIAVEVKETPRPLSKELPVGTPKVVREKYLTAQKTLLDYDLDPSDGASELELRQSCFIEVFQHDDLDPTDLDDLYENSVDKATMPAGGWHEPALDADPYENDDEPVDQTLIPGPDRSLFH